MGYMETIIEIAGYILGATVLFGATVALFLLRAVWYQPNPVVPHPEHLKLPTEAVDAIRQALDGVKRRQQASTGAQHEELSREALRLEARMSQLEQQTFDEQKAYQYAIKLREAAWLRWNELHDRASALGKRLPPDMREPLKKAERNYRESHRVVEEERHTAVARDMMNLEELKGQAVLTQAATSGTPEDAPTPSAAAHPASAPAHPAGAEGAPGANGDAPSAVSANAPAEE